MKKSVILFLLIVGSLKIFAQGTFSGDLMLNYNSFQRDTNIKASGNPLYDNYLSGSEGWLDLRYNVKGYTFFVRADAFNNSNLKQPTTASTDFGIGAWSISKDVKELNITVGSIYDIIGSGILFRAYEDRGLLIDNALMGIKLKYKLGSHVSLKAFSGQQKNNSVTDLNGAVHTPPYGPIIKGFNAEGDYNVGNVHLGPGIGIINRTLDAASYQNVVATMKSQNDTTATENYNMYAFSVYNTLSYKGFSWYVEGAYKTKEAIIDTAGKQVYFPGNVEYTTLTYGRKGLALSLAGKRTEHFVMRVSPGTTQLNGMLNWQPIVAVLRPERLMSRYTPASLDYSEQAGTANVILTPNDVTNFNLNYTNINTLGAQKLYREGYVEANYQGLKSWIFQGGVQYLEYNISAYQTEFYKDSAHLGKRIMLYAVTPFAEITYRFTEKKSVRFELQYMDTKQDYGSWVFALLEYDLAPKWSISASDMYNVDKNYNGDNPDYLDAGFASKKGNNYYNIYASYSKGANRYSLAYVKQVDGINCSGGVCRYEPAFSGIKATITSSF
jgi:Family of unknown function (DUF6029)